MQEALKTSSWKRSLTSRVMLRLPMSMSGFRTKSGLVNKIRLPDCGPGVVVAPELFQQQQLSTSISSVPSALQPGQRKPCSVLWVNREVMKQHLALIAARTKPGRHAVVITWTAPDGIPMECADDFPTISLIKLPPYSPRTQSH